MTYRVMGAWNRAYDFHHHLYFVANCSTTLISCYHAQITFVTSIGPFRCRKAFWTHIHAHSKPVKEAHQ